MNVNIVQNQSSNIFPQNPSSTSQIIEQYGLNTSLSEDANEIIKETGQQFFSNLARDQAKYVESMESKFESAKQLIQSKILQSGYTRGEGKNVVVGELPLLNRFREVFKRNIQLMKEAVKINKSTLIEFKQEMKINFTIIPISDERQFTINNVSSSSTVRDIKSKIQNILGISSDLLNLHYKNKQLLDQKTFHQYEVQPKSVLHLSYKLRGGSQIFIVMPSKKKITLDCQKTMTILQVIQKLLEKEQDVLKDMPISKIVLCKLIEGGRLQELHHSKTLKQTKVQTEEELLLMIRQKESEIFLIKESGNTITVPYDRKVKISKLKQIESEMHLKNPDNKESGKPRLESKKVLIFKGRQLEDRKTLRDERIQESQGIFLRERQVTLFLKVKIKEWSDSVILDLRVPKNDTIDDIKIKIQLKLQKKFNIQVDVRNIKIKQILKEKESLDDVINIDAQQAYFEAAIDSFVKIQQQNKIEENVAQVVEEAPKIEENEANKVENA